MRPQPTPAPNQGFRQRDETALNAYFFKVSASRKRRKLTQPYWLENQRKILRLIGIRGGDG
jgi:hypothetical protein